MIFEQHVDDTEFWALLFFSKWSICWQLENKESWTWNFFVSYYRYTYTYISAILMDLRLREKRWIWVKVHLSAYQINCRMIVFLLTMNFFHKSPFSSNSFSPLRYCFNYSALGHYWSIKQCLTSSKDDVRLWLFKVGYTTAWSQSQWSWRERLPLASMEIELGTFLDRK